MLICSAAGKLLINRISMHSQRPCNYCYAVPSLKHLFHCLPVLIPQAFVFFPFHFSRSPFHTGGAGRLLPNYIATLSSFSVNVPLLLSFAFLLYPQLVHQQPCGVSPLAYVPYVYSIGFAITVRFSLLYLIASASK